MKQLTMIFALLAAPPLGLLAQPTADSQNVRLTGRVTELTLADSSEVFLAGAQIEIWSSGELLSTIESNVKGRYDSRLSFFKSYVVKYKRDGYVMKMVEIDATDFAEQSRDRGFIIELDMTLFRMYPGCKKFEFLGEIPIAKASYNKREGTLVWDNSHTSRVNERIRVAVAECRK